VGGGRLGDAGAFVADLDQGPVAVAGSAHGQPAVPMAGERSWANPSPMRLTNKANDHYRAARRSTRRRWRRITPSPNHTSAPKTAVMIVYHHSGQVKVQNRNWNLTLSVFWMMKSPLGVR
jgi:hypothetical protein